MAETKGDIAGRFGPARGPWLTERKAWWAANRDRLVELVDAGLTANAIAIELGVSRNAVMGQVHRTRLKLAREPTGGRRRPRRVGVKLNVFPPSGNCVWPHGDPGEADFGFCAARTAGLDRPYCTRHERVAFLPPREMRPLPEAAL